MSRLWWRVDAWWFEEAPATRLAMLRILIGAFAFVYLAMRIDLLADVGRAASNLFEPVGLARMLHAPIHPALFDAVVLLTLLVNLAFILGWKFRVTGPAFGILLLFVLSYRNSWSMIYHTDNAMVLHALILGCTRAADAWALDARPASHDTAPPHGWRYGWPVRLMGVVVVCTYFVAGLAKVLGPLGWAWASGESMRGQILVDALRKELLGSGAPPLAFALADELWLFTLLGVGTLLLELGASAALVSRRVGRLWAVNAFLMHWGIFAIMGILFRYQMIGLVFAPFFRVERLVDRARSTADRFREADRPHPVVRPVAHLGPGLPDADMKER